MEQIRILLIDDDEKLGGSLKSYLSKFSIELVAVTLPSLGMQELSKSEFDLILLDGMLPEKDGLEVCREVRAISSIPIIMLTGRVEEEDKILGLDYGADDYVTKPFSPRELVARINSLLRRSQHVKGSSSSFQRGDLKLDGAALKASLKGQDLELTTQEFEVLAFLVDHASSVQTRESIMKGVHGEDWTAFDRALDIAISRIRKKIKKIDGTKEYIKTVWGKGYMYLGGE
ncbi:MAG: response regulator transcription factor [Deltaproteobacteria bacterium]|nr:MAG: response regulator transcription factor [Deltaproteobacteria bacterium]